MSPVSMQPNLTSCISGSFGCVTVQSRCVTVQRERNSIHFYYDDNKSIIKCDHCL